ACDSGSQRLRIANGRSNRQCRTALRESSERRVDLDQRFGFRTVDSNLLNNADDLVVLRTVVLDVLAKRTLIRPEAPCERLVDEDDCFALFLFVLCKGAAFEKRDIHRPEVICGDDGPVDIDQLIVLPLVTFYRDIVLPISETWQR